MAVRMLKLQSAALILLAPLSPFLKDAILAADATVLPKVKVKQMHGKPVAVVAGLVFEYRKH